MKKKNQLLLTCAISILILCLLFCFLSKSSKEKTYSVFLLNQDVQSGSKIEKDMVYSVSIPLSCAFPDTCQKMEDIEGRYLACDMKNGELIAFHDLQTTQSGVVYPSVSEGKVLYTLALKAEDANGWWISKGNEILLYIYDDNIQRKGVTDFVSQEKAASENSIQIIEQAKIVRVMDETGKEIVQEGKPPGMICLELSEEQAQQLFKAENSKKIKLIALNPKNNK